MKYEDSGLEGLSTSTIGAVGELLASAYLIRHGHEVYRALSASSSCDLLSVKDGRVFRFEIRSGKYRKTSTGNKLAYATARVRAENILVVSHSDGKIHHFPQELIPSGGVSDTKIC